MNKRALVFVIGTLFAGVTLLFIPFCSKKVLNVPHNAVHAPVYTAVTVQVREDLCTGCHSAQGTALPASHPVNPRCLYCHPLEP